MSVKEPQTAWQRSVLLRRVAEKVADERRTTLSPAGRLDLALVRHRLDGTVEPVPAPGGIARAYESARDSLLILGPAGGGKTTALFELAAHLLAAAHRDPATPVPVVLDLVSWTAHRGRLEAWLVAELGAVYEVPELLAEDWLDQELIIPLLDGLDELPEEARAACAEQINGYRRRHGLVRLAVCCRTDAYPSLRPRLRLHEVVELQPPALRQILVHLQRAGVRLDDEQVSDSGVMELLATPLFLALVTAAYRDRGQVTLPVGSLEQRRAAVFSAYLNRALDSPRMKPRSAERTRRWLARLAGLMNRQPSAEFRLDRVQPDLLSRRWQRRTVLLSSHLMTVAFGVGLCFAAYAPVGGALAAAQLSAVALVLNGLVSSALNPAGRWPITPVEPTDWRPPRNRHRAAPEVESTGPNEDIRRSGRQALRAGSGVVLLCALPVALAGADGDPQAFTRQLAAVAPLLMVTVVLPVTMRFGGRAWCRHMVLRTLLVCTGWSPLRLGRMIEDATGRKLLVRSGRAYRFPHRLLAEDLVRAGLAPAVPRPGVVDALSPEQRVVVP